MSDVRKSQTAVVDPDVDDGPDDAGQADADSLASTPARATAEPGDKEEPAPKEIGGRDGPDPTRYGDWEKDGRCIDF